MMIELELGPSNPTIQKPMSGAGGATNRIR